MRVVGVLPRLVRERVCVCVCGVGLGLGRSF